MHGDESIHITCDKNFYFELTVPLTEDTIYYLLSGETGEYGRTITLNANTDMPDDFNGNAKKEVEFEIKEDENIVIPNNDKGVELIVNIKE